MTKINKNSHVTKKHVRKSRLCAGTSVVSLLFMSSEALAQAKPAPIPDVNVQAPVPLDLTPADIGSASAASGGMYVPDQSFGPFGNLPAKDLPYSTNSIPQKIITDQQAKSLQDIVLNDPSVSIQQPAGSVSNFGGPTFNIRGFALDPSQVRIDGNNAYGAPPPPEALERVDVLKGSATVLYGFDAPGGVINAITKKPLDMPLTEFSLSSILNNGRLEGATDISRRFGPNDQFGLRLNLAGEGGYGPVNNTRTDRQVYDISLDWKPIEGLRLWTHDFYNQNYQRGIQPFFFLSFNSPTISHIPAPVDPTKLLDQPWSFLKNQLSSEAAGFDYDHDNTRIGASISNSFNHVVDETAYAYLNNNEQYPVNPRLSHFATTSENVNLHVGHTFDFGLLKDSLDVALSDSRVSTGTTSITAASLGLSSLSNPTFYQAPTFSPLGFPSNIFGYTNRTLNVLDRLDISDYVSLIGGSNTAYFREEAISPGASDSTQSQTTTTPMAAVIVKPVKWASLYGSYIEALELGAQAPEGAVNEGQFLPPYLGSQLEVGTKVQPWNGLDLNLAGFKINQQYAFLDPADNVYKAAGHQQNLGIEFTAEGKVTSDFSVFGGIMTQSAKVVDVGSQTVTGPGNLALGVPNVRVTCFGEYAVPMLPGLTLMAGTLFNGKTPVKVYNSDYLYISNYVTVDLGAKYETIIEGHPVSFNLYASNVTNTAYWTTYFGGLILQDGTPRTVKAKVTMRF